MFSKSTALGLFFLACTVFASTDAEKNAVYELLEAQDVPNNIRRVTDLSVQARMHVFSQMENFRPVIIAFFRKHLSYDAIKEELAEIYLRQFTMEEIRKMTDFYRSPVGKKMARSAPVIMSETMELLQKKIAENSAELIRQLQQKNIQTNIPVPANTK